MYELHIRHVFPPTSAVEGIKLVRCVCLSVCLLFSALMVERFDIRTWKLIGTSTLIKYQMSLKVKVIGQGRHFKNVIFRLFDGVTCVDCKDPFCDDVRRRVTSCDVLWQILGKNTDKENTAREGVSMLRHFHWSLVYLLKAREWVPLSERGWFSASDLHYNKV